MNEPILAPTTGHPDAGAPKTQVPSYGVDPDAKGDEGLGLRLESQWKDTRSWSSDYREEAREDRAFFDNEQWSEEQKAELKRQGRPATTINRIFKAINNLAGRERESRYSWKVFPRGDSDKALADAMTKGLAYVADMTKARYAISRAFKDALKGPMGWLEVGVDDEDLEIDPIYVRHVPWDEMWLDPETSEPDLDDARYVIRARWIDEDLVKSRWPNKTKDLDAALAEERGRDFLRTRYGPDFGNQRGPRGWTGHDPFFGEPEWVESSRRMLRLREHWWWQNHKVAYLCVPGYTPIVADPRNQTFVEALGIPGAYIHQGTKRVYHWAIC
ncbi:MAG: hypothetical protein FJZ00_01945, partial [Candidatus Sericytochromatia bacterium]|nr:hypothetical protein [Candidatus Tanganyikabacteria bacterium]